MRTSAAKAPGPPPFVTMARRSPRGRGCLPKTSAMPKSSSKVLTRKTPALRNFTCKRSHRLIRSTIYMISAPEIFMQSLVGHTSYSSTSSKIELRRISGSLLKRTRKPENPMEEKGRPGFNSSRSAKTYLGSSSSSFFTCLTSLENSSGSCFAKAS